MRSTTWRWSAGPYLSVDPTCPPITVADPASPPAVNTPAPINTGSQPKHDGILSFAWANGDNIPVNLFNEATVRQGQMEKVMRQAGATTIAGLVHKANPRARVVALSGYKYYAADALITSTSAQQAAQAAQGKTVVPVVNALEAESAREVAAGN